MILFFFYISFLTIFSVSIIKVIEYFDDKLKSYVDKRWPKTHNYVKRKFS